MISTTTVSRLDRSLVLSSARSMRVLGVVACSVMLLFSTSSALAHDGSSGLSQAAGQQPRDDPPAPGTFAVYVAGQLYEPADFAAQATWAACGVFDDSQKLVRTFTGRVGNSAILPGNAQLRCGSEAGDGSGWGYQHIRFSHGDQGDWGELAYMTGGNWRDLADFAIENVLRSPGSMTGLQSNQTVAYRAPIEFRDVDDGSLQAQYSVLVSVSVPYHNIITAYPENF